MAGKSLDDLNLSDVPLPQPSKPLDPRETAWYQFSQEIDDLLSTGRVTWAEETLKGIQESVEAREIVTEGQRRAVRNIAMARERERPRSGRWSEGFNGRQR